MLPQRVFTLKSAVWCLEPGKSQYHLHVWLLKEDRQMQGLLMARAYTPWNDGAYWTRSFTVYHELRAELDWLIGQEFMWE